MYPLEVAEGTAKAVAAPIDTPTRTSFGPSRRWSTKLSRSWASTPKWRGRARGAAYAHGPGRPGPTWRRDGHRPRRPSSPTTAPGRPRGRAGARWRPGMAARPRGGNAPAPRTAGDDLLIGPPGSRVNDVGPIEQERPGAGDVRLGARPG